MFKRVVDYDQSKFGQGFTDYALCTDDNDYRNSNIDSRIFNLPWAVHAVKDKCDSNNYLNELELFQKNNCDRIDPYID